MSATAVYDDLQARELEILDSMEKHILANRIATAIRWGIQSVSIVALNSAARAYATNRQTQREELDRMATRWADVS